MKAKALCERCRILRLRTVLPHCKSAILSTTTHKNSETKTWQNRNFIVVLLSTTNPHSSPIIFESYYSRLAVHCHWTGTAQSVQRPANGWTVRGSNSGGGEIFRNCPARPWCHLAPYAISTRPFTGVKRLGRGADQPPLSSAEVKERVRYAYINLCAHTACNMMAFNFHRNTYAVFTEVVIFN